MEKNSESDGAVPASSAVFCNNSSNCARVSGSLPGKREVGETKSQLISWSPNYVSPPINVTDVSLVASGAGGLRRVVLGCCGLHPKASQVKQLALVLVIAAAWRWAA